jgi:hypothetical protein
MYVLILAILSQAFPVLAETLPVVAVFEIEDQESGLRPKEISILTDYLGSKLGEGGTYNVVPRAEIKKRLLEQKQDSFKSCYDESCQIELGRELSAQFTLRTTISRAGSQCLLTSVLYDLKTAASHRSATAKAPCEVDRLVDSLDELVAILKGQSPRPEPEPKPQVAPVEPTQPVYRPEAYEPPQVQTPPPRTSSKSVWAALAWSIFPGGGLYYTGHWFWGTFFLLEESAAIIFLALVAANDGDSASMTVGGSLLAGGFAISAGLSMIFAATYDDDRYASRGSRFRPEETTEPVYASRPGIIFPVYSTRF